MSLMFFRLAATLCHKTSAQMRSWLGCGHLWLGLLSLWFPRTLSHVGEVAWHVHSIKLDPIISWILFGGWSITWWCLLRVVSVCFRCGRVRFHFVACWGTDLARWPGFGRLRGIKSLGPLSSLIVIRRLGTLQTRWRLGQLRGSWSWQLSSLIVLLGLGPLRTRRRLGQLRGSWSWQLSSWGWLEVVTAKFSFHQFCSFSDKCRGQKW